MQNILFTLLSGCEAYIPEQSSVCKSDEIDQKYKNFIKTTESGTPVTWPIVDGQSIHDVYVDVFDLPATLETAPAKLAIQKSFQTWESALQDVIHFDVKFSDETDINMDSIDALNIITFDEESWSASADKLATTATTYESSGNILQFDTYFNSVDHIWGIIEPANLTPPEAHDVQAIMTHEIGHALGFSDLENCADNKYSVMCTGNHSGETTERELFDYDLGAVDALYGDCF